MAANTDDRAVRIDQLVSPRRIHQPLFGKSRTLCDVSDLLLETLLGFESFSFGLLDTCLADADAHSAMLNCQEIDQIF